MSAWQRFLAFPRAARAWSFGLDGRPRYIEVKATKLGALTPFYITYAELDSPAGTGGNTRSTACWTSTATPPSSTPWKVTSTPCWPWSPSRTAPARRNCTPEAHR